MPVCLLAYPEVEEMRSVCCKCGSTVDPLKVQFKGAQKFKCQACNTKHVSLSKMYGGWPNAEFAQFSTAEQQTFWQTDAKGQDHLERLVVGTMVKRRMTENASKDKGKYLPLSVYAQQGFDIGKIESTFPRL